MESPSILSLNPKVWRPKDFVFNPDGNISLPISRIKEPVDAVRRNYGDLHRLKASIKRQGLLQPLGVRPLDPEWREFEPIIGCRRYAACSALNMERVNCYIRLASTAKEVAEIALEENTYRKNLSIKETCDAVQTLVKSGRNASHISAITGIPGAHARALVKLPDMPKEIRSSFLAKDISISILSHLARLDNTKALRLWKRVREEGLSERAVGQIISWGEIQKTAPTQKSLKIHPGVRGMLERGIIELGEGSGKTYIKVHAQNKTQLFGRLKIIMKSSDGLNAMKWGMKRGRKPTGGKK